MVLTAGEYRAAASAICARANQRLADDMPQRGLVEPVAFAEEVARDAYAALERLMPPEELAELHREMLLRTRELLDGFPAVVAAAEEGPAEFAGVSAAQGPRNQKLGADLEALWVQLGVPECNR